MATMPGRANRANKTNRSNRTNRTNRSNRTYLTYMTNLPHRPDGALGALGLLVCVEECEEYGQDYQGEGYVVVPVELLGLEQYYCKNREYNQRNAFLDYLELDQIVWTAVFLESDAVGRYHKAVFHQCDAPTEQYHQV